jgi:hypothetical protein
MKLKKFRYEVFDLENGVPTYAYELEIKLFRMDI